MIPRITPRGLTEFKDFISGLARNLRGLATKAIGHYIIGDEGAPGGIRHGLKHYPPYRYVSRKSAYPQSITIDYGPHKGKVVQGYQSSKQYYYVILGGRGKMGEPGFPHRNGRLQRGWQMKGESTRAYIVNTEPHAVHVMGTDTQARQPAKVGWRTVAAVISSN